MGAGRRGLGWPHARRASRLPPAPPASCLPHCPSLLSSTPPAPPPVTTATLVALHHFRLQTASLCSDAAAMMRCCVHCCCTGRNAERGEERASIGCVRGAHASA